MNDPASTSATTVPFLPAPKFRHILIPPRRWDPWHPIDAAIGLSLSGFVGLLLGSGLLDNLRRYFNSPEPPSELAANVALIACALVGMTLWIWVLYRPKNRRVLARRRRRVRRLTRLAAHPDAPHRLPHRLIERACRKTWPHHTRRPRRFRRRLARLAAQLPHGTVVAINAPRHMLRRLADAMTSNSASPRSNQTVGYVHERPYERNSTHDQAFSRDFEEQRETATRDRPAYSQQLSQGGTISQVVPAHPVPLSLTPIRDTPPASLLPSEQRPESLGAQALNGISLAFHFLSYCGSFWIRTINILTTVKWLMFGLVAIIVMFQLLRLVMPWPAALAVTFAVVYVGPRALSRLAYWCLPASVVEPFPGGMEYIRKRAFRWTPTVTPLWRPVSVSVFDMAQQSGIVCQEGRSYAIECDETTVREWLRRPIPLEPTDEDEEYEDEEENEDDKGPEEAE